MAAQGQPRRPLRSFGSRRPSKPLVLCKSTRDKSQGRHFLEEDRAGGLGSWLTLLLPTTLQKGLGHTLLWVVGSREGFVSGDGGACGLERSGQTQGASTYFPFYFCGQEAEPRSCSSATSWVWVSECRSLPEQGD